MVPGGNVGVDAGGSTRGLRRAEDDDIDCVLDPAAFAATSAILPDYPAFVGGWDKMAAGRTSRRRTKEPRSGLCVVINGNLKQRELTISFFISSPMLSALGRPIRTTHTDARRANTRAHGYTHTRAQSSGMLFAPRVDLPLEGGKRASERKGRYRAAWYSVIQGSAPPCH